jgi:secreted trypsin-like serine protease
MTNSQDTMDLFAGDVTNTTPMGQGTEAFVEENVPADAQPSGTILTDAEPPNVPPITSANPYEPEGQPPLAEYAARDSGRPGLWVAR